MVNTYAHLPPWCEGLWKCDHLWYSGWRPDVVYLRFHNWPWLNLMVGCWSLSQSMESSSCCSPLKQSMTMSFTDLRSLSWSELTHQHHHQESKLLPRPAENKLEVLSRRMQKNSLPGRPGLVGSWIQCCGLGSTDTNRETSTSWKMFSAAAAHFIKQDYRSRQPCSITKTDAEGPEAEPVIPTGQTEREASHLPLQNCRRSHPSHSSWILSDWHWSVRNKSQIKTTTE